jgi:hypothetical protein
MPLNTKITLNKLLCTVLHEVRKFNHICLSGRTFISESSLLHRFHRHFVQGESKSLSREFNFVSIVVLLGCDALLIEAINRSETSVIFTGHDVDVY